MTVFLTPAGEPFLGGTYFPPEPRHGLPELPAGARRRSSDAYRERARRRRRARRAQLIERDRRSAELGPRASRSPDASCSAARARGLRDELRRRVHGGWGARAEVPAGRDARVPAPRADGDDDALGWSRRRSTRWPRAACTTSLGGGFHRYSVDAAVARAALREDALRQRAARRDVPPRLGRDRERSATARSPSRRSTTCCASSLLARGRLRLGAGRRHRRRRGPHVHVDGGARASPAELLRPVRARPLVIRGELDEETRARLLRAARAARRSRRATTRRSRRGTASRSPRSRRPARRLDRPDLRRRRRSRSREFLLGPLSDGEGRLRRSCRAGQASGARLPRRLRERRARAARAPRRDRRAALARAGAPARPARGRALRRRRARRLLPRAARRRARSWPRTKDLDDNPTPVGELDARARPAPARADLRRRRARAARGRRLPADPRRRSRARRRAFGWALCALDLHFSPPRELAIVGPPGQRRRPRRARAVRSRAPSSPSARRRACRCSRARGSSTASPPSTSASASPAARR